MLWYRDTVVMDQRSRWQSMDCQKQQTDILLLVVVQIPKKLLNLFRHDLVVMLSQSVVVEVIRQANRVFVMDVLTNHQGRW